MRTRRNSNWELDLHPLVHAVAEEYAAFLRDAEADPRSFGARHAAAKAALAHLESLMKLAQGGSAPAAEDVTQQLRSMRAAMAKEPTPDDDEDREPG